MTRIAGVETAMDNLQASALAVFKAPRDGEPNDDKGPLA